MKAFWKLHIRSNIYNRYKRHFIERTILGNEKISIKIGWTDLKKAKNIIRFTGDIYKIENRQRHNRGQSIEEYVIHFCDEIRLNDKIKGFLKLSKRKFQITLQMYS